MRNKYSEWMSCSEIDVLWWVLDISISSTGTKFLGQEIEDFV